MNDFRPQLERLESRDCPSATPVTPPVAAATVSYTVPNLLDGHVTGLNLTNVLRPVMYATCHPPVDPWRMSEMQLRTYVGEMVEHLNHPATVAATEKMLPQLEAAYAAWWNGPAVGWYGVEPVGLLPSPPTLQVTPELLKYGNISEGVLYNLEVYEGAGSPSARTGTVWLDVPFFLSHWLLPPPGVAAPTYGQAWTESLATAVNDFYNSQAGTPTQYPLNPIQFAQQPTKAPVAVAPTANTVSQESLDASAAAALKHATNPL